MANVINATSTGNGGLVSTGDDSGILNIQTNETTAITVDASQNVGIGTASPTSSSVLDVVSGGNTFPRVRSSIGSSAALFFQNSDTGTTTSDGMYVGITGAEEGVIWNNENTDLRIATNNTERMRIDSSGNLLVGGTSRNGTGRVEIKCTNGVDNGLVCYTTASGGANGTLAYFLYNNTTFVGSITSAGSSTSYGSISDYRLKENVQPMTGALSKVAQLKPCTYKWKSNGSDGQGFIAHELQAVVPDAVVGEKDALDSDENPIYQNVDTSFLVATLTAALQETKALIDTQAETINALTARIVALEQA
jgi:hypothetical protein